MTLSILGAGLSGCGPTKRYSGRIAALSARAGRFDRRESSSGWAADFGSRDPNLLTTPRDNFCDSNSLLPLTNCLLFEIFSLLICIGNCAKSRCGTAVSCSNIVFGSPGIAIFPVKFPVSREFAWRRVRSALRRQPGSPSLGETVPDTRRKARQWRAFTNWPPVPGLRFWASSERNSR
jgi:hypothetical protein